MIVQLIVNEIILKINYLHWHNQNNHMHMHVHYSTVTHLKLYNNEIYIIWNQ